MIEIRSDENNRNFLDNVCYGRWRRIWYNNNDKITAETFVTKYFPIVTTFSIWQVLTFHVFVKWFRVVNQESFYILKVKVKRMKKDKDNSHTSTNHITPNYTKVTYSQFNAPKIDSHLKLQRPYHDRMCNKWIVGQFNAFSLRNIFLFFISTQTLKLVVGIRQKKL